jgi:hypothetical protein
MQAEKLILETDGDGHPKELPKLPPNARIEAIFLVLGAAQSGEPRKPSARIAGKGRILGDIVSPVVPTAEVT